MKTRPMLIATCLSAVVLAACSDGNSPIDENSNIAGNSGGLDPQSRRLTQFDNSEAFYSALQDALIDQSSNYSHGGVDPEVLPVASPDIPLSETTGADGAGDTAGTGGEDQNAGNEVTSTNVQEVGVDEQDRVKISADGTRLYVLADNFADHGIPLPDQTISEPDEPIEPGGTSMPAVVDYSKTLRIMSVDAETPDTQALAEVTIPLEGGYADGFYLYESGSSTKAFVTSSGSGYWQNWNDSAAFSGLFSQINQINVTDPSTASIEESFKLDGQLVSSRRIGNHLFFVSRYYPAIPGAEPWNQTEQEWQQTVESTDLSTIMPQYTNANGDQVTPLVNPSQCFVSKRAEGQSYYSPDIITLGAIDLNTMQLTDSQCFLGSTETLYASTEAIYLATTQYDFTAEPFTDGGVPVDINQDEPITEPWSDPRAETDIHQFDIDGGNLVYAGSGAVRGHLGWNPLRMPFRMSERNGYLRVATMNDQQGPNHSPILVSVLQADGQGNLNLVSQLPNDSKPAHIGKPGEMLYASRFVGDRAYLVTFRQTDPLYVIDLENPADTAILGELEIEGYSDFLYPIDANHLFAIGRDAVAEPQFGGALVQGIKLSLFDVSNPSAPSEIESILVGQRGSDAVALYNHRAITIQPANENHPMRVSFGIDVHGDAAPVSSPSPAEAGNYYGWSYTGLHGFDVTIGPGAGIERRGAMIVGSVQTNQFDVMYGDDRSEMVGDAVFYVNGRNVYAAHWDTLSNISDPR